MKRRILIVGALVLSGTAMPSLATPSTSGGFVGDTGSGWDTTSMVSQRQSTERGDIRFGIHMIDGSGINPNGAHHSPFSPNDSTGLLPNPVHPDPQPGDFIERFSGTPNGPWIEFNLGGTHALADMHVWNYPENAPNHSWTSQGLKDIEVLYTTTGGGAGGWGSDTAGDWTSLSLVTLNQASTMAITDINGLPAVLSQEIPFGGADAAYVIIRVANPNDNLSWNYAGTNWDVGLGEVRFYAVPEPASLALLGLGGLALFRRRRMK
jgi:hypothetical protein